MADEGLYTFSQKLDVGQPGLSDDFLPIAFDDSRKDYHHYIHAAHGMIYAQDQSVIWKRYPVLCNIMVSNGLA